MGSEKPEKPSTDFPLYAHKTKRWAKKIKGKIHYFGPWDDPDGALDRYRKEFCQMKATGGKAAKSGPVSISELEKQLVNLDKLKERIHKSIETAKKFDVNEVTVYGWKKVDRGLDLLWDYTDELEVSLLKTKQACDRNHKGCKGGAS